MSKEKKDLMRLRLRVAARLDDTDYPPNSYAIVSRSKAAWELVNSGGADLDPAPGTVFAEVTQPTPEEFPEFVTEAEPAPTPAKPTATKRPFTPEPHHPPHASEK